MDFYNLDRCDHLSDQWPNKERNGDGGEAAQPIGWTAGQNLSQPSKEEVFIGSNNLSERHMSVKERQTFQQAKMKELQSFFQNSVWEFSTAAEADPARTLSSRMLLKWSRNPDGSPRAKARLIVRGYADVDALEGRVDTAAPHSGQLSMVRLDCRRFYSFSPRTTSIQKAMGEASNRMPAPAGCR